MKRIAITSLSLAALLSTFSGSASASGQSQSAQLAAGSALLGHSLSTKDAVAGQVVTAKLISPIETPEGLSLPRGTQLLGRVAEVQASHDKSPATLTLVFDKARTKGGKEVPIKATLIAMGPQNTLPELPAKVATNEFDQPAGELPGVSLHSVVQSDNSGVLTSKDSNIRLDNGTEMTLAVAPLTGGGAEVSSAGH